MHCAPQDSAEFEKRFISFFVLLSVILVSVGTGKLYAAAERSLTFEALYEQECAVCHGNELQGEAIGVPLVGRDLLHGQSLEEIAAQHRRWYSQFRNACLVGDSHYNPNKNTSSIHR
jgi:cytochrome c553